MPRAHGELLAESSVSEKTHPFQQGGCPDPLHPPAPPSRPMSPGLRPLPRHLHGLAQGPASPGDLTSNSPPPPRGQSWNHSGTQHTEAGGVFPSREAVKADRPVRLHWSPAPSERPFWAGVAKSTPSRELMAPTRTNAHQTRTPHPTGSKAQQTGGMAVRNEARRTVHLSGDRR